MLYLSIVAAGGIGALMRYLIGRGTINLGWTGLPFGTLIANLIGCFLMGYLSWMLTNKWQLSKEIQSVLLTGFLGGFTTFSAFSLETVNMLEQDNGIYTIIYVLAKVVLCICLCFVGIWLAKQT